MWRAVLWGMALTAAVAAADSLAVGGELALGGLLDQHDRPAAIDESTRLVLFTRDMGASDAVAEALGDAGAARLAAAGAVWVADISRMPRVITRFFALPAMRKRPYVMVLDRDGKATAALPQTKGRVTLLRLDRLRVTEIAFADDAGQVLRALEPRP